MLNNIQTFSEEIQNQKRYNFYKVFAKKINISLKLQKIIDKFQKNENNLKSQEYFLVKKFSLLNEKHFQLILNSIFKFKTAKIKFIFKRNNYFFLIIDYITNKIIFQCSANYKTKIFNKEKLEKKNPYLAYEHIKNFVNQINKYKYKFYYIEIKGNNKIQQDILNKFFKLFLIKKVKKDKFLYLQHLKYLISFLQNNFLYLNKKKILRYFNTTKIGLSLTNKYILGINYIYNIPHNGCRLKKHKKK